MLEERGLATTVIGLVRPHMERSGNPRGLFVPFPLGRPLGEAGDAAFQPVKQRVDGGDGLRSSDRSRWRRHRREREGFETLARGKDRPA